MEVNVHIADYVVIALYFVGILFCGMWFGRNTKSTNDFFFGGQRFSWWLVAISCVATLIGSYSFITYSETAFTSGISSTVCYTNDWFIIPLFVLAWLPIIYFSRVTSIPEYFERRFDQRTRIAALIVILVYLIGYIGINLYTIGTAVNGMLGFDVLPVAIVVAIISAVYMHGGGQTSVIMTDLMQGFILIITGFVILFFGLSYLGGFDTLWQQLPVEHKMPFAGFNSPPAYHSVGLFWSDAITASIAFFCMNQGVLMRFMSTRSVRDGKKAIFVVILIFMPIAAIAVSNAGWIGKASMHMFDIDAQHHEALDQGKLSGKLRQKFAENNEKFAEQSTRVFADDKQLAENARVEVRKPGSHWLITEKPAVEGENSSQNDESYRQYVVMDNGNGYSVYVEPHSSDIRNIFVTVSNAILTYPGLFGLVMAALVAALMSTIDTYITAVSAIAVNDIWRPWVAPDRDDKHYLNMARLFAIAATILGILLVPVYGQFDSIFQGFTNFCSLVTPPMIVVIALGAVWRRFTPTAAFVTLVLGSLLNYMSIVFPQMVTPFAHGVAGDDYSYMRAFFGTVVSVVLAVGVSLFTKPKEEEEIPGLVFATINEGKRLFKGGEPSEEGIGNKIHGKAEVADGDEISLSKEDMEALCANEGDLLYVSDARGWLGGLRSAHVKVGKPHQDKGVVRLSSEVIERGGILLDRPITVEKMM